MKILKNYVVVKPNRENDEYLLPGDKKLYISGIFEQGKHAVVRGKVAVIPVGLCFSRKDKYKSLQYDTELEVQVGDDVIYHYLEYLNHKDMGKFLFINDEKHLVISYDSIYCAIRNDQIIMCNGYILVEAAVDDVSSKYIETLTKEHVSQKKGVVAHIGSLLKGYLDYQGVVDSDDIKVGDTVVFNEIDSLPMEYSIHQSVEKGKTMYRMQRKDVIAKLN